VGTFVGVTCTTAVAVDITGGDVAAGSTGAGGRSVAVAFGPGVTMPGVAVNVGGATVAASGGNVGMGGSVEGGS
jgi:hypothetical protein